MSTTKRHETEIIDKLFLELAQFTNAKTDKEESVQRGIGEARNQAMMICCQLEKCKKSEELRLASEMAHDLESTLHMIESMLR